jgi:cytochrome c553
MKLLGLKIAIVAVVSSSISALACEADLVCVGETIANRNCVMCHGPAFQGYWVAPRLAGQRPQYIQNQLRNFLAHSRDNPYSQLYMWRAAAKLDTQWGDADGYRAVAAYFATLEPKSARDGNEALTGEGANLFSGGEPAENVPACAVCHGPNAVGSRNIPRLGGLSYYYLKRRLELWGAGYHASASYPMPLVARNLSPEKIEALASYLSFIDYGETSFK